LIKDLQGVDKDIIEHMLDMDERVTSEKQRLRKMSNKKAKAVKAEVQRNQDAKIIREVMYPLWLANTIPVKKKKKK
jgi:SOS response regulatory protein OraA/RecX